MGLSRGSGGRLGAAPATERPRDANDEPRGSEGGNADRREHEARWYSRGENGDVRCELCPRDCVIRVSERGACRVRENRGGTLYSLVYGRPAMIQADPVERAPFFHVEPGSRMLAVATAGCPLQCSFCEVWDIALVDPEEIHSYDALPEAVVEQAEDIGASAVSYAFGEPIAFSEYVLDTARIARKRGLLNLLHTSGYFAEQPLGEILEYIDAVNIDLKAFDDKLYRQYVGGNLEPVLRTMRAVRALGIHLEITNLVIPTVNDDPAVVRAMCRWIRDELGADVPVHFARFYPLYKLANLPPTPVTTLDTARTIALEEGLEHVYVARVTGHEGENTFCPACGSTVIKRLGFVIEEMNITDGACAACGRRIRGLWG
ncbi:MAG: AmmeMemoRadiSam system radical SAM enzyme [Spirochaetaceae bacterium]|nr:MAG: AmmeMemoRadiSam system radical SAM enzyme [Spirochaetaceae bacterium]